MQQEIGKIKKPWKTYPSCTKRFNLKSVCTPTKLEFYSDAYTLIQEKQLYNFVKSFLFVILDFHHDFEPNEFSKAQRPQMYQHFSQFFKMQDERNTKKMLVIVSNRKCYRGHSIITSLLGGRWVYTFFVILRDGKLGGRVVRD